MSTACSIQVSHVHTDMGQLKNALTATVPAINLDSHVSKLVINSDSICIQVHRFIMVYTFSSFMWSTIYTFKPSIVVPAIYTYRFNILSL